LAAYDGKVDKSAVTEAREIPGEGVSARVNGQEVLAGNLKLMNREKIRVEEKEIPGTVVYVAIDGGYAGYITIADEIKADSRRTIKELKESGIKKTVMLTGDTESVGRSVAKELRIDEAYTQLLPHQKVEKVEELLKEKSPKGKVVFVGDGMNDAPVLARADLGIAMGGLGADAALEAADIVIMTDEPSKIIVARKIAARTLGIAKQNIWIALGVKFLVLALGLFGIATMWEAVFADVGVAIIAVANSIRVLNVKRALGK